MSTPSAVPVNFATRRLWRDWRELRSENSATFSALPTDNFLLWHANIRPNDGPYAGTVFHLVMQFPENYPHNPPVCRLSHAFPHPNVFFRASMFPRGYICLDLLKPSSTSEPYAGWSSAYTLTGILCQLQSFFFAEHIPQEDGDGPANAFHNSASVAYGKQHAQAFTCTVKDSDGKTVVHTHDNPWPPLRKSCDVTPAIALGQVVAEAGVDRPAKRPRLACVGAPDGEKALTAARRGPVIPQDFPSAVYTYMFGFLDPQGLFRARDVCTRWRKLIVSQNLFERRQLSCFHTKANFDDDTCILGVGLNVEYMHDKYGGTSGLKTASAVLDLLSLEAFAEQHVNQGVWGKEVFGHFLPLIFNEKNARRVLPILEARVFAVMALVPKPAHALVVANSGVAQPYMFLELYSVLMNTMVVELMKQVSPAPSSAARALLLDGGAPVEITRHASEKALEGYCAFHHALLYFAHKYPEIKRMVDRQVHDFLESPQKRTKKGTPNLGVFLVGLNLSDTDWDALSGTFLPETFDRHVRWVVEKHPELDILGCDANYRTNKTFEASLTSLRLLMFQVYFLKSLSRPTGTNTLEDMLRRYNQQLGRPTTAQKEALQRACKDILAVRTWTDFFQRCGVATPSRQSLYRMLEQAVINSQRKGYHRHRRRPKNHGHHHGRRRRGHHHHHHHS